MLPRPLLALLAVAGAAAEPCQEPEHFTTVEVPIVIVLAFLVICVGGAAAYSVGRKFEGNPGIRVGDAASHGDWDMFTAVTRDRANATVSHKEREQLHLQRTDATLHGTGRDFLGVYSVALEVQDDGRVTGTKTYPHLTFDVDLRMFSHWSTARRPGLYGTLSSRGSATVLYWDLRVRDNALNRHSDPVYKTDRANGLRLTWAGKGWYVVTVFLAVIALLIPYILEVGDMVAGMDMPPAGGVWGPAMVIAFSTLLLLPLCRDGTKTGPLLAAVICVPCVIGAIGCMMFGAAVIDSHDYCGYENDTVIAQFCDTDGDAFTYACVVTSEYTGDCAQPKWESWCVTTDATTVDTGAFRSDVPAALRAEAVILMLAGLCFWIFCFVSNAPPLVPELEAAWALVKAKSEHADLVKDLQGRGFRQPRELTMLEQVSLTVPSSSPASSSSSSSSAGFVQNLTATGATPAAGEHKEEVSAGLTANLSRV